MRAEIVCGEKKHPGGKLVRVCVRALGDKITGILVSGDFFAESEEETERLIERLSTFETRLDSVEEELRRELESARVRIYGVEVADILEALRRAVQQLEHKSPP